MDAHRAALAEALRVHDETERLLEVAAVVSEALAEIDVEPVVVGGLAVAYWTSGVYRTSDIDVVMPPLPEVDARLQELGFERRGRFWLLPSTDVFLEAPGSFLQPDERDTLVELAHAREVRVLSAEDLLVGRLHEFVATGHSDALGQALLLLDVESLDRVRLEARLAAEALTAAMQELERIQDTVSAGGSFEAWELHEISRKLR